VSGTGLVSALPLTARNTSLNVFPDGPSVIAPGESVQAAWRLVDGGYFDAMHIPLRRGRTFAGLTPEEARRSVVISASLGRALWGDADPVGRQIDPGGNRRMLKVIGVVGDIRARRLGAQPTPAFYWSMHRFVYGPMHLVVNAAGGPTPHIAAIRSAAKDLDPTAPLFQVTTLDALRADSLQQERLMLALLGGYSAIALLLAALGTYGVIAFATEQRTREIGLRIAVGAEPRDILKIVLSQGARLVAGGVVLGIAGALAGARVLGSLLYETGPRDPLSYLAATVVLVLAALVAAYVPARRATRVDPMEALRAE
jgi:putative ABC transport system permease protein